MAYRAALKAILKAVPYSTGKTREYKNTSCFAISPFACLSFCKINAVIANRLADGY